MRKCQKLHKTKNIIDINEVEERDTATDVLRDDLKNENCEIINITIFDEIKQIYLCCGESSRLNSNSTGDH